MSNDSIQKTILVTVLVCLFCSIVVSTAAVVFKPAQEKNIELDMKRNILAAAGMLDEGGDIDELFSVIETRVVDLSSGEYSDAVSPDGYSPRKAAKDPAQSRDLGDEEDLAKIGRLENYALVYLVNNEKGKLQTLILPVRGYGLWSTLHGFIALESDLNTVVGMGFYEHGETPGLGGEVDNPRWKALWPGKKVFSDKPASSHGGYQDGTPTGIDAISGATGGAWSRQDASSSVALQVIKGTVTADTPHAEYKVDGLSGATLTSKGVHNMMQFWLGENGYGNYLHQLRKTL